MRRTTANEHRSICHLAPLRIWNRRQSYRRYTLCSIADGDSYMRPTEPEKLQNIKGPILNYDVPDSTSYTGRNYINLEIDQSWFDPTATSGAIVNSKPTLVTPLATAKV